MLSIMDVIEWLPQVLLKLKHASNRPVYFRDLCVTTKILPVSHFNTCMQIC